MLNLISFVGVDSQTDLNHLEDLLKKYREIDIEFSILYSEIRSNKSKKNDLRYPTYDECRNILTKLFDLREVHQNLMVSVHLCGTDANTMFLKNSEHIRELTDQADRVQLNFNLDKFDADNLFLSILDLKMKGNEKHLIFQNNHRNKEFLERIGIYVERKSFLNDASGGNGKEIKEITPAKELNANIIGYAGGINPDNVVDIIQNISDSNPEWSRRNKKIYIDMESGIRSIDEYNKSVFDLNKCEDIIKKSFPYLETHELCPDCDGRIRAKGLKEGGGIGCTKCDYWFCF